MIFLKNLVQDNVSRFRVPLRDISLSHVPLKRMLFANRTSRFKNQSPSSKRPRSIHLNTKQKNGPLVNLGKKISLS